MRAEKWEREAVVPMAERMATYVERVAFGDLSDPARAQLKIRILDSLGCAIGAAGAPPIRILEGHIADFGRTGRTTLIGGGKTSPDLAALYNGARIRYLDFNDSYLAKGETCHPSDNLASVLAASEYAGGSGKDLLCALAVAYQVQCRLSDEAPVRAKGFDHTTQGAYAVAAGVSKALGLDRTRIANAIAISGTAFNALRVTRTGALSHWKGLAYPNTGFAATHATFLAMRGITGPAEVFEGNKGFMDAIAGKFAIDWEREDLERVRRTILKRFNAEIHSQSTLEGALDLMKRYEILPEEIAKVEIETFDVAYHIIGGGEEGAKTLVRTKEEADHSLPYMVAVALLDGDVMPEQYAPERIARDDAQSLLRKVTVRASRESSERFPAEMPCRITLTLTDGRRRTIEKRDYEGFTTRPMSWETVVEKFLRLGERHADRRLLGEIVRTVGGIESLVVADLMKLLEATGRSS